MIKVHTRVYDETKSVDKNALYKINKSTRVVFKEQHEKSQEVVNIDYCLEEHRYAIYANEYRRPEIDKNGCKTADVLSCVFDDSNKKIQSFIFDVKSDISAFSYGFSQLRALEFFVFRKMEMPETQNPPAMRVESICL